MRSVSKCGLEYVGQPVRRPASVLWLACPTDRYLSCVRKEQTVLEQQLRIAMGGFLLI